MKKSAGVKEQKPLSLEEIEERHDATSGSMATSIVRRGTDAAFGGRFR